MTERTVDSDAQCSWHWETYDASEGETPTPPEYCSTGKPALFYNCTEHGPVCEDHTCRCRPKLLTERAERARRDTIGRCLRGLRLLGVPEEALAPVLAHLQVSGITSEREGA
jgi:hypothetical protein